nr:uncharacterized protein LOC109187960 [Ipomoea trifida]GME01303.1 uncharacterized protein LOC109187960 [Ipomoea batatas]
MSPTATSRVLSSLLFLLLFITSHGTIDSQANTSAAPENEGWVPLLEPGKAEKMAVMLNDTRRKLGSFQICALCTCCGGAGKGYCLPTPCCYAINCNIPNRPFGFCSFTPKTCNCFGCHL